jgi:WD40 repeat protein
MPTATRTFRVFVSSTFEDLKEERNALQREVFPKLAKLCEEHGARFQAIDLRWGVRDEAGLDQKTMEICLAEIERCKKTNLKPNFIVLLGDRYGWRPLPARIEAGEFERIGNAIGDDEERALVDNWYQRDDNAVPPEYLLKPRTGEFTDAHRWGEVEGVLRDVLREAARNAGVDPDGLIKYEASATHQEILKGLGREPEGLEHVFAFLRNATKDQDPKVGNLKETLKHQLGENVFSFDAGDYDELCRHVRESVESVILNEVARFESRPAIDLEIDAQNAFAADRSKYFVGRAPIMSAIADYIRSDDPRPMVIYGASGSGKSAIIAKASGVEGAVRRFIGATPESSNGLTLLRSLCQEIARRYGQPEDVPATFNELAIIFSDRIKLATRERPLLVFLDALDQLGSHDPAAAAEWLPVQLPPYCRVVVSTIEVPAALRRAELIVVEPFSAAEADQALALWFEEVQRTLQKEQRDKLLASFRRSPLPLYLKLVFEEARCWKSFTPIDQCVLGEGLGEIIDRFFSRLSEESSHGPVLVSRALGYLTAARYGLAEDEILAVLSNDDEVWEDFRSRAKHEPPERRLPVIVWSRLYLDLEPYLTERAAPGGTVISFYHRLLVERASRTSFHCSVLASYFAGQPLWLGSQRPNQRKVTELVRQQVKAELLDEAVAALTDIEYLEAKCAAELVFDLQEDYREAMMALPDAQAELREEGRRQAELARWTKELVEYARQWSARRDQRPHASFLARLFGRSKYEQQPKLPEIIRSVEPWTVPHIAAESKRIIEDATRLDRLKAFSRFVEQAAYPLLEFGERFGFVAQHAFNQAPAGPVHNAASSRLASLNVPMLLRFWPPGAIYDPMPALLRTLEDRSGVWSVSMTPDGRRAVSGGGGKTLRLWDVEAGQCLRAIEGHTNSVGSVNVTPDGRKAISGGYDWTLRVWDLETGACLKALKGDATCLSVTPDGRKAISGGAFNLHLWDLEKGLCTSVLKSDFAMFTTLSMTPDGRRAVSGGDSTLRLWDLETGQCLRALEGHNNDISSVSITPDGRRAASGGKDMTVRVWDLESGRCLRTLAGHADKIESVSMTPDGRLALSASWDGTLRMWELETGQCLRIIDGHAEPIKSVSLTPDGRRALSGSTDSTLRVWNLESGRFQRSPDRHTGSVLSVSVAPEGRRAVSGSEDKTLRVWDVETGQCLCTLGGHLDRVTCVNMTPDGRLVLSASWDGTLRVWEVETEQCLRIIEGHAKPIESVSMTPDGRLALSASRDGTLLVWNLETGQCLRALEGRKGNVQSVSITPDGRLALSANWDGTLRMWELETGQCLRTIDGRMESVLSMSMTSDGQRALLGSADGSLWVWELKTGQCLRMLEGHIGSVLSVSVTPDGRMAASGGYQSPRGKDYTVRIWDLQTGHCLVMARLAAPCGAVDARIVSRIAVGTSAGEVLFFDARGLDMSAWDSDSPTRTAPA